MEFIEKYFIIFAALLVALGFAIVVFCARREVILHKRKAISYENYKEYKKHFIFEPNKLLIAFGASYLVLLLVVVFLIIRNDVLRIYLIALGSMEVLVGASLISYYFSKSYNKNLTEFDSIYENISNSYINKQKLLDFIKVLKAKREEIRSDIKKINSSCESLVLDYKGIDGLNEIDKPLSDIILAQESIANGFDNTMTSIFTKSLIEYLKRSASDIFYLTTLTNEYYNTKK